MATPAKTTEVKKRTAHKPQTRRPKPPNQGSGGKPAPPAEIVMSPDPGSSVRLPIAAVKTPQGLVPIYEPEPPSAERVRDALIDLKRFWTAAPNSSNEIDAANRLAGVVEVRVAESGIYIGLRRGRDAA